MNKNLNLLFIKILLLLTIQFGFSQNNNIEKSIFEVETGLFGVWFNNETKLTNNIALKSEIGLEANIWDGKYYDKTGFSLTPTITVEPRLYYNLTKRASKGRNVDNNSANFLSLNATYRPNWFVISNYNVKTINQLSVIPKWGIKRNFGKSNFNYEFDFGLGYSFYFLEKNGKKSNESGLSVDIDFRFGYTFKKEKK